jgi:hypothetical protein
MKEFLVVPGRRNAGCIAAVWWPRLDIRPIITAGNAPGEELMAISPGDAAGLLITVFAGTGMLVLVRAFARRVDSRSNMPSVPREIAERMERMERAIDAVAIEIERMSENQRFLTRLLAERGAATGAPPEAVQGRLP